MRESTRLFPFLDKGGPGSLVRFSVIFLLLAFLLSVLTRIDEVAFRSTALYALNRTVASTVATLMSLGGTPVLHNGNTILYGADAFIIIADCTGIDVVGLYVAAVFAFPSDWRKKGWGVVFGVLVLMGVNLVRIVSLIYIGARWPEALEYGHLYVWPVLVLAVGLGLWLSWVRRTVRGTRRLA